MEIKLLNQYCVQSFNESEAFSFGGLWQCNYKINGFTLSGEYLLDAFAVSEDNSICVLVRFELYGNWRSDIHFFVVIIDVSANSIFRLEHAFKKISILAITNDTVSITENFAKTDLTEAVVFNWRENSIRFGKIQ